MEIFKNKSMCHATLVHNFMHHIYTFFKNRTAKWRFASAQY